MSALTANALAADTGPLSAQITPALSTIAAPGPVAGRFIVIFRLALLPSSIGRAGECRRERCLDHYGIAYACGRCIRRAVAVLRADAAIEAVEADQVRNVQAAPSDPSYSSQWSLSRIGWDQAFGSVSPAGSATVAILDTGVDASHRISRSGRARTSILDPAMDGTTDAKVTNMDAGIVAAATDNGRHRGYRLRRREGHARNGARRGWHR